MPDAIETSAMDSEEQNAVRPTTTLTVMEKTRGEKRLMESKASGTLLTYVVDLLVVTLFGVGMVIPVLFVPVNDPDEGFWENINYFFIYQPYVSFVYILGSYTRLGNICHRGEGSQTSGKPAFEAMWGCNCRSLVVFFLSWLTMSSILAVIGWACGENVATSYQMMYGCPIACTTADVMFMMLLPQQERSVKAAVVLATYAAMCGIPIFAIFMPVAVKVFMPPMCAALIPVFIFPLMGSMLHSAIEPMLEFLISKVEWECSWMDSGVPVHLEAMICIAEMMLFPGAESIIVLCAIVFAELIQRLMDLRSLRNSMVRESGSMLSPAHASYSHLKNSELKIEPNEEVSGAPTDVGTRRRRLMMVLQDEGSKNAAKERARDLAPDAYAEMHSKGVVQLTTLSAPSLFVILTYIITKYQNRDQYYVYECLPGDQELVAVKFALITLAFQVGYFAMDISFLYYHGTEDAFLMMFQSFVQHHGFMISTTLAFTAAVFTSCFMIKHDGIVILEHLIRTCDLEAIRAN